MLKRVRQILESNDHLKVAGKLHNSVLENTIAQMCKVDITFDPEVIKVWKLFIKLKVDG